MAHAFDTLFDALPFGEPKDRIGFMNNRLERDAENRDETTLATALAEANTRFHVHAGPRVLVSEQSEPTASFDLAAVKQLGGRLEQAVLLGRDNGVAHVSVPARIEEDALPEEMKLYDMRALLYSSSVSDADASAIAQGTSLLAWHRTHRFCGKCGSPNEAKIGGYRRECPKCEHKIFPRTDPVVIMLAVKGDRCVMGRSPHFPPGWYSTLAGFVEPGETIEDAVRRETQEESGIRVGRVRYHASQPWPFPHSLMIGAHCEAISQDIDFQANELEDCRWFDLDEVKLMVEGTHPDGLTCPPRKAISYELVRSWVQVNG